MKDQETKRSITTAARRRLIVEAAADCFIEKGFHQASIRDIAGQAKVSLGNLYNHFENKAALIAEIATLEAEEIFEIEKALEGNSSPSARIESFAESFFDYMAQPKNTILAAEILAEALRNETVAVGFENNRKRLVGLVAKTLDESQHDGRSVETANLIVDLVEAAATRVAFDSKRIKSQTKKSVVEAVNRLVA